MIKYVKLGRIRRVRELRGAAGLLPGHNPRGRWQHDYSYKSLSKRISVPKITGYPQVRPFVCLFTYLRLLCIDAGSNYA